jgi:hypothetical protein
MDMIAFEMGKMAGLLEGEAHFGYKGSPNIQFAVNDIDVVRWVARKFGSNVLGPYRYGKAKKYHYRTVIHGEKARFWMRALYPHFSKRRKAQIKSVIGR